MITLRPYQKEGAAFLAARPRAYLADGMRVGKTLQALAAAGDLGARSIFVAGPASARHVWPYELKRAAGSGLFPHGEPELRFESYSKLARGLPKVAPDVVILDEGHRLKNPLAKVTQHVLGTPRASALMGAYRVWALSGTPMPNNPLELYTIAARLWPDHVSMSYGEWRDYFCTGFHRRETWGARFVHTGVKHAVELRGFLHLKMLRRTFEQVADQLASLEWGTEWIDAAREDFGDDFQMPDVGAALERDELPALGEHLMRARRLIGAVKARRILPELREQIEDGAYGRKLVVIAYHREAMDTLEEGLRMYGLVRVDGSTPPSERERRRLHFMNDPGTQIFLGQLQACMEGIDLSVASHMVLLEPGWSPGVNAQIGDRLRNPAKKSPSFVTVYGLAGTFDEQHAALVARKARGLAAVGL